MRRFRTAFFLVREENVGVVAAGDNRNGFSAKPGKCVSGHNRPHQTKRSFSHFMNDILRTPAPLIAIIRHKWDFGQRSTPQHAHRSNKKRFFTRFVIGKVKSKGLPRWSSDRLPRRAVPKFLVNGRSRAWERVDGEVDFFARPPAYRHRRGLLAGSPLPDLHFSRCSPFIPRWREQRTQQPEQGMPQGVPTRSGSIVGTVISLYAQANSPKTVR